MRDAPGRVIASYFTLNNLQHIKNRNKKRGVSLEEELPLIPPQSIAGESACWFGCAV
jgi:hypothetical protein